MLNFEQWQGFKGTKWRDDIDTRDFILNNYTPYDGDESFLEGPTDATNKLWGKLQELQKEEARKGRRSGHGYGYCFRNKLTQARIYR